MFIVIVSFSFEFFFHLPTKDVQLTMKFLDYIWSILENKKGDMEGKGFERDNDADENDHDGYVVSV